MHAASVLEMAGGGNGERREDVGKHVLNRAPNDRDGSKFDEIADAVVAYVDVLGLGGGCVVGGKGDTVVVVLEGDGGASNRTTKGR